MKTTYKIVRTYTLADGEYDICEHCGRIIRRVAIISNEQGKRMKVGYDCSATITGDTSKKYETRKKRIDTVNLLMSMIAN